MCDQHKPCPEIKKPCEAEIQKEIRRLKDLEKNKPKVRSVSETCFETKKPKDLRREAIQAAKDQSKGKPTTRSVYEGYRMTDKANDKEKKAKEEALRRELQRQIREAEKVDDAREGFVAETYDRRANDDDTRCG